MKNGVDRRITNANSSKARFVSAFFLTTMTFEGSSRDLLKCSVLLTYVHLSHFSNVNDQTKKK